MSTLNTLNKEVYDRQQLKRLENCSQRVGISLSMKSQLITIVAAVTVVTTAFAGPIHDVVIFGDLAGVQAELDKGADVNAKGNRGDTPLHEASDHGKTEIIELLIAKGADVNAIIVSGRNQGKTPLDLTELTKLQRLAKSKLQKNKPPTSSANTAARRVKN